MNRNIRPGDPEFVFAERMRAACPTSGQDWYKFMVVNLEPGKNIKQHKHKHHLVMYYPKPADPIIIHPMAGTMLYLPPGTLHEVPPVSRGRISIAMLMDIEK